MNAEAIKSFLVSLGFDVDEAGQRKFEAGIVSATAKVVKLGVAVEAAALSVVAFTTKIASGLDDLYWASQRTGATVAGIQRIGYAVGQMGGSVNAARSSLENLAQFIRNSPGAEGFLNRLGVQTRDASGQMRDMASIFTGVGQRLNSMPYFRANQYAQMLGIDENTLMAMRRGLGQFSAEYTATAKAIGFNAEQAAASSNKFMTSMREFGMMAGMARDKIGANLASGLAGSIDNFRKLIVDNFPRIETGITVVIKSILWLADIVGRVVYRLVQAVGVIIDWWGSLDKSTKQIIAAFGAMLVAWRLLNSAFAMSPIGRIIALAAALAALVEDYATWKEGGQSLIDWSKWEPGIQYAQKAIGGLSGDFGALYDKVVDLGKAIWDAIKAFLEFIDIDTSRFSGKWLFDQIIESVRCAIKYVGALVDALKKLVSGDFSGAWDSLKEAASILADSPMGQGVTAVAKGVYTKASNALNQYLPEWMGGTPVERPKASKAGEQLLGWMGPMLTQLESLYKLPAGLLRSVATTESAGNQFAVSEAGAKGLFQFMDGTARDMGLRGNDVFDPMKSAQAAAKYLAQLLKANGGDLDKALASYNWGIGNVQKHGMALMPRETRDYIPKVRSGMPSINQETNITVYGSTDAQGTADAIADKQDGVNSRTVQQVNTGNR
ncbi:lytic transglycosylase domain-containing protein [Candidatus Symbiopectobacterium sp. NZEC127]|uniref:lytic transglycosylase domain-containing protein n=1 Tax=Candidatus Symbiopectobacterium sp. NZEC127 TaxID=2820472 RepID=UPI002225E86A|nr:lytic transglycosylase domain-containing protein [Candidatus Symbiopectobacterium sp. NZEC127]MCW2485719.1 lytic transglycosylase domain-containing protein [Candidatus Symbiopectobacterium sp. NZEC127]